MTIVLRKIKIIFGIALCVIGLASTLVPIVPGVPIVLAGLALMGSDHPLMRNLKERLRRWRDSRKYSRP